MWREEARARLNSQEHYPSNIQMFILADSRRIPRCDSRSSMVWYEFGTVLPPASFGSFQIIYASCGVTTCMILWPNPEGMDRKFMNSEGRPRKVSGNVVSFVLAMAVLVWIPVSLVANTGSMQQNADALQSPSLPQA